jgi:hypothetical protein
MIPYQFSGLPLLGSHSAVIVSLMPLLFVLVVLFARILPPRHPSWSARQLFLF